MSWMNVDLHQLAQQKEPTSVALPGQQPGQRAMRRTDSNKKSNSSRYNNMMCVVCCILSGLGFMAVKQTRLHLVSYIGKGFLTHFETFCDER